MAFNDFLKKAKETAANAAASAANAANAAKAKMDEKKQQMDAQKAERERIRAEKQAQADQETQQMLEAMSAENGDLFQIDTKQLLSFTAEFYDKLYLPAHSVSASKLLFHPLDQKINKYAQKEFPEYNPANESPIFMILGKNQQKVFLSSRALYFKKAFDEEATFFCVGNIPIDKIKTLSYQKDGDNYIFSCNQVIVLNSKNGFELDINAFQLYISRIQNRDFAITNEQIDALIKEKIGDKILKIVQEYVYEDELLLYFAWGCDSITAKDFIVCSDRAGMPFVLSFQKSKGNRQFLVPDESFLRHLQIHHGDI